MSISTEKFYKMAYANANDVMSERQDPLMADYQENPENAKIIDEAITSSVQIPATTPLYGQVVIGTSDPRPYALGVHKAVGGRSDFPNPGEILSAALAGCLDSTIRIIANRLGIQLHSLSVHVVAHVDVRGTLLVDPETPVGFQNIDVTVRVETKDDVDDALMKALINAAENSCVILQTLRRSPEISISSEISSATQILAS